MLYCLNLLNPSNFSHMSWVHRLKAVTLVYQKVLLGRKRDMRVAGREEIPTVVWDKRIGKS